MTRCRLDHLVIAAATLEAGAAWFQQRLGVAVPEGGSHPLMGTHNRVMRLGPASFLEIIAIDPDAPPPGRPRWFSLDDPATRMRIAAAPALLTWVARTHSIDSAVAAAPISTGPVEEGRRGGLAWRITIPEDGSMPESGLFPTLIQWPASLGPDGPVPDMADLGCRLERLTLRHPDPARLEHALAAVGADGLAGVELADAEHPAGLTACIASPRGVVEIS